MSCQSYVYAYGFFVGYSINKGTSKKEVKISNPVTAIKNRLETKKESKELQKERDYWEDVYYNLENYDGSIESQREVRNIER